MEVPVLQRLLRKYRDIITYGICGVFTMGLNWLVYALLADCAVALWLCNAVAWLLETLAAYFTNKQIVFRDRDWSANVALVQLVAFFVSRGLAGVEETVLQPLLAEIGFLGSTLCGVKAFGAKVIVTVVAVVINFTLGKCVIFRSDRSRKAQDIAGS